MNYKNILLPLLIIITISIVVVTNKIMHHKTNTPTIKIGILQTASHPALDAAREGFVTTVQAQLGNNVECVVYNTQGSIITAHTIAERLHADESINAIYAIATPALQAIAAVEKKKPIFIAAVTDPYALGLISPAGTNICGTTDMIDIYGTVKAIREILPHVMTVALLYNPAEKNSVIQVDSLEKELIKNNIAALRIGITSESDIPHAVTSALAKVDALLTPTDNLIASAMPLVSHLARNAHKPLIACHNQAVEQGALMARGVDYYESGKETGEIAVAVLRDGKKPSTIPIRPTQSDIIMINKDVLDELNITIAKISDTLVDITSNK